MRGWDFILPGWCWLYEYQIGDSTPCGEVSTLGTIVFVPGLFELETYRRIHDLGMASYPPRVALFLPIPGWR